MEKEKKKKKKSETGMHLYLNYCARYFVLLLTTVMLQNIYIYIYIPKGVKQCFVELHPQS